MTVGQLIERLQELPDYHEVAIETEDGHHYSIEQVEQRLHGAVITG